MLPGELRSALRRCWAIPFFLGAFLVLLALWFPTYGWDFDQSFSALHTLQGQDLRQVWEGIGREDAHPPGYYFLYKAWMALGGYDPLPPGVPDEAVRHALLLGLLGFAFMAGAVALAGWSLLGPWGGVLALGLLFLFQDAPYGPLLRMYPFAGGLVVLSAWAYLFGRPFLGSLLGTLGLYTHYLVGVAVAPFALLSLYRGLREGKRGALRLALAFLPYLLFLPWLPMLAYQVEHGRHFPHVRPSPEALFLYVRDKWPRDLFYLFLLLSAWASWRRGGRARELFLGGLLALYLWFYLSLGINVVLTRYVFLFSGLIALGLAGGLYALPRWGRPWVALGVLLFGLLSLHYGRHSPPWEDITAQARVAQAFLAPPHSLTLYMDGRGRVGPFRLHLPGLEGQVVPLSWSEAGELCQEERAFLLWRYHNYRPEESPVEKALGCLRGRVHVLHPTPVGTLYLVPRSTGSGPP